MVTENDVLTHSAHYMPAIEPLGGGAAREPQRPLAGNDGERNLAGSGLSSGGTEGLATHEG